MIGSSNNWNYKITKTNSQFKNAIIVFSTNQQKSNIVFTFSEVLENIKSPKTSVIPVNVLRDVIRSMYTTDRKIAA